MATDLQVFLDTVNHRTPERLLYTFDCTPDLRRRLTAHAGTEDYGAHYGCFRMVTLGPRRPADYPAPDYRAYWHGQELPPGTRIDNWGVARVPAGYYHFEQAVSPLRHATSLREIEDYPLDDMMRMDFSHYAETAARAHAEGRVVAGGVWHMYENAWQIRGYEEFLMDMLERPAWAECLLERLFQQNMVKAVAAARAGADMLYTADDVANQESLMFSPRLWRQMMLSRWRQVWQAAKAIKPDIKIWYHSDGNIIDIVDDMVEAGLDILNPLQPECLDVDAIYARHADHLTFEGCIGTQSTMPFGTPEDVRARVREVIERYGRRGGLIVAPTHTLEPEVPIANIEALVAACQDYSGVPSA